ncbi:DNA-binding response regulator [Paenibacillus oleatilyticus]|uniref:DNA-binding response regulator n=1 Tax=Paenibacillus oleatilyticus TaxID=2594886 RepID=UPI001C1F518A|nr:DNA-binding response regulator [Paenibacillus oleatilyticus]MBU7315408.1 DNA-binding response regulator [Paenibacillus oleatilyticus]
MRFQDAYEAFLDAHVQSAAGERLRRLKEGLGHAEKLFLQEVWWPAVGRFEHLHPEFEVHDFKDGTRYLDFAYLRPPFKVCFEIDGYGPHSRDASRWQFADQLVRQNHLVIDDWKVFRFAYDDIKEKPRRCQQMIQQLMGRWFGDESVPIALTLKEKEIVRLLVHKQRRVTPAEVSQHLGVSVRYARELLQSLLKRQVLVSASGTLRVRAYLLNPHGKPMFL